MTKQCNCPDCNLANKEKIEEYKKLRIKEELEKQIQSQKNPNTTAEGVKIGRKSRITPKVMPEKVLYQSSDTLKGEEKKQ